MRRLTAMRAAHMVCRPGSGITVDMEGGRDGLRAGRRSGSDNGAGGMATDVLEKVTTGDALQVLIIQTIRILKYYVIDIESSTFYSETETFEKPPEGKVNITK